MGNKSGNQKHESDDEYDDEDLFEDEDDQRLM